MYYDAQGITMRVWEFLSELRHFFIRPEPVMNARILNVSVLILAVTLSAPISAVAQPEILVVTAHPDDEAMFAATMYRVTHDVGGAIDLALVTDGSGGFRYATLGESIYGLKLTDEAVARKHLPAIRKRELMEGGAIVGLRNYFFLDQPDPAFTTNLDTVLTYQWNTEEVKQRLRTIMLRGYDFVFVHLPIENFHGHHKAASLLAIEIAQSLPPEIQPVVLGSFISIGDSPPPPFRELDGYPVTRVMDRDPFIFDRNRPIGLNDRLNYHIIVNWLIAAHKSQGTMQLFMNRGDIENFWVFESNPPDAYERAARLFEAINEE